MNNPPTASIQPHRLEQHGDLRTDEYYWLRERDNPQTLAYLEAENAYLAQEMQPLDGFQEKLYQQMLGRIQQTDLEVPIQDGPYFYYSRTEEGQQYRIYCRKKAASRAELASTPEEVILDLNHLAQGKPYLSVMLLKPSPDHTLLAYLQNEDGSDRYTAYVKNLQTGELLPDRMDGVYLSGSLEWDSSGQYLFYTLTDATQRPYRLYRHRLGAAPFTDPLIYEEPDPTFVLVVQKASSQQYLFALSRSTLTTEVRYLPADSPEGQWQVFAPRVRGVEYRVYHHGDYFYLLTNQDALNFKIMAAPVENPVPANWQEFIPHRPAVYLQWMHPLANYLLIFGRENGLTQLWVYSFDLSILFRLNFDEPLYTLGFSPSENRSFENDKVLLSFQSMVTPKTVLEVDLFTRDMQVLKQEAVLGGYDKHQFVSERIWAKAQDGTSIPISLVYRRDAGKNGPAPLYLYGYGSYGFSIDPTFNSNRLALLERGVIFAIAHVRGGAEMGRGWYEGGKLLHKKNTFTDFIDCAEHLIQIGYTAKQKLVATGASAGGLLMGVIVNLRPDLFRAVVAHVPFVDVITTMSDPSIPLTTLEYDEWGNPTNPQYYAYMKSYSPYDNVEAKPYPHLLVTTGLNDPRVAYWEPAKWVARLRTRKTGHNQLLLKTHMGAGHGGSSGRYDRLREIALEYAFLLDKLGIES